MGAPSAKSLFHLRADRQEATCGHQPGKKYGGRLCYTLLEDPTDAYEWSFVAVPAQPAAGVTKATPPAKPLHLTPGGP